MNGKFFLLFLLSIRRPYFSWAHPACQRFGRGEVPGKGFRSFVGIGSVLLLGGTLLSLQESLRIPMGQDILVWGAEGLQGSAPSSPNFLEKPSVSSQQADSGEKPSAGSAGGDRQTGQSSESPSEKPVPGQVGRLIDQEPYDRIFLDAANGNVVLEVFPLDLPGRQIPTKPTRPLVVRLLNRPDTNYEVAWSAIVKIELFEQRVLQEALEWVRKNQFEEAYEYFQYLYKHYPKMAGLDAGYEEALWQEAAFWYQQRQYDRSLAVLRTLWERNKDRPQLDRAMGAAVERRVEEYAAAEDYQSARTLIGQLAAWYPQHDVVEKWEGQFRTQAATFQAQAQAALEKNALREASEAARKMIQIWPDLPGAQELFRQVHQKYPRVVVGVCLPARCSAAPRPATSSARSKEESSKPLVERGEHSSTASTPTPSQTGSAAEAKSSTSNRNVSVWDHFRLADMADWSARRTRRLLCRQWMEMVAPGLEGGQYRSPVAGFRIEDLGQQLIFQLRPNLFDDHGEELTGYRLAELLLNLANPRSAWYRPEWADRVVSVSVHEVYTVEVALRRAHVRPESLLTFPIAGLPGPYQTGVGQGGETLFLQEPRYFALSASQPKEIVEVAFDRPSLALAALRAGKVDLVDRVPPTELERLRQSKDLQVGQYAIPVVHVLVPNRHRPLPSHPRFRRALEYGIPREAILRQLCGGQTLPGFQVLSAPIPLGATHDDPIGYAYDRTQKARSYNPRLALALARVAWAEVSGTAHALADQTPDSSKPAERGVPPDQTPPVPPSSSSTPSPLPGSSPETAPQKPSSLKEKPSEPAAPPPEKKRPADPFSDESPAKPSEEKKPPSKPPADPFSDAASGSFTDRWAMGGAASGRFPFFSAVPGWSWAGGGDVGELPKTGFVSASVEEKSPGGSPSGGQKDASDGVREMPALILVHPPTEPARTACRAIRRALRLVGIPIQLQEVHPADLLGPNPPPFDLAYLELSIQEPVADLPCLLGEKGPVGLNNPFLAVSLADLYQAPGWREVRQVLYRIHQITLPETPMVPLWQTVEYFAYRTTLRGVGQKPVCLYEDVEAWQIVPEAVSSSAKPTEKKP